MRMEMEREREMEMEMEMDIFGALRANREVILGVPKASWELRFASKRLWTADFEALEAAGAPRGHQKSPKKPPRRPQVTIHRPCRWIMSSQGAAGNPLQAPKVLLGSQNGAQGSSEELPRGFEELKRRF